MTINYKHIIFVVVCFVAIFYAYMYYKPEPPVIDEDIINSIRLDLEYKNQVLQTKVDELKINNKAKQGTIDSLQSLKPKIKYVIIEKNNEIDNASVGGLINEYNRLFSTSRIK